MRCKFWVAFKKQPIKDGNDYKRDEDGNFVYSLVPENIFANEQKMSGHAGVVVEFDVDIADEMFAPLVASAGRAVFPREAADIEGDLRTLQHKLEQ